MSTRSVLPAAILAALVTLPAATAQAWPGLNGYLAYGSNRTGSQFSDDVYGYDAYAWALYQNGNYGAARDASDHALAQGTPDAKLYYHSGLIAKALGDTRLARARLRRALTISPNFDPLQARRARAALAELG